MGLIKKVKKLLTLESTKSTEENVIRYYLKSWNSDLQQDSHGNLYIINPGTPLICAHMDTVMSDFDHTKMNKTGIKVDADTIKTQAGGVLGADDRAGVALAMQIYEDVGDNVSILFCSREESGRHGSRGFATDSEELLRQCLYCIVPDRMNSGDIIGLNNGYCSEEFEKTIYEAIKGFGYKPTTGVCCDADSFSGIINSVNLSVGYYEQHRATESLVISEYQMAYYAILYIIGNIKTRMKPFKAKELATYGYNSRYDYGKNSKNIKKEDVNDDLDMIDASKCIKLDSGLVQVDRDIQIRDAYNDEFISIPAGDYAVYDEDAYYMQQAGYGEELLI